MSVEQVGPAQIAEALPPAAAVDALRQALVDGYDPATDAARQSMRMPHGEMLIMPSAVGDAAGIKVLTVAPADPGRTLPRIQGQYLLFDGTTLSPRMILDGEALTSLRTPAVSFAGVKDLLVGSAEPLEAVVFGTGPQGVAHAETLKDLLRGVREVSIAFVSRTRPEHLAPWLAAGSPQARAAVARAGLVVCATTSTEPLLGLSDVRSDAVVVAVGSHSPDARELASDLMGAAQVIVEDLSTALAECGDVVLAVEDGSLDPAGLITMRGLVRGEQTVDDHAPVVFKTSGMSWEDLILSRAIAEVIAPL
ncbi:ornithine cyclodeaminase family protein [Kocuria coralli]|uniref:Ornithine cyclodeaminase family protein n=1 Tax=Kocuria coralli TaxID=1461025 RepID=A0A5J5KWG2_9MICC|nr:ornithine cyclodeaminase family protein [Kocuria coralli]KAA9393235.1 ornithine cyclodeaminase family protein [Kocuria coralli]